MVLIFADILQITHVKQRNGQAPPGINIANLMDNDHRHGADSCQFVL